MQRNKMIFTPEVSSCKSHGKAIYFGLLYSFSLTNGVSTVMYCTQRSLTKKSSFPGFYELPSKLMFALWFTLYKQKKSFRKKPHSTLILENLGPYSLFNSQFCGVFLPKRFRCTVKSAIICLASWKVAWCYRNLVLSQPCEICKARFLKFIST